MKQNDNEYPIEELLEETLKENKQLKELKYRFFDNCGDEESFTLEDYLEISNKLYDYEQENKQLKECYCNRTDCIGRIKDSRKYDSVKQQLDKATSILTELEEWLKEEIKEEKYMIIMVAEVLDKIQELKEKYYGQ